MVWSNQLVQASAFTFALSRTKYLYVLWLENRVWLIVTWCVQHPNLYNKLLSPDWQPTIRGNTLMKKKKNCRYDELTIWVSMCTLADVTSKTDIKIQCGIQVIIAMLTVFHQEQKLQEEIQEATASVAAAIATSMDAAILWELDVIFTLRKNKEGHWGLLSVDSLFFVYFLLILSRD